MESNTVIEQEAYEIGVEAYTYFLLTRPDGRDAASGRNVEAGKVIGRGPMNAFTHVRTFPPADFRDVVRPNFDTLYSIAWLDLAKEPLVVSAPDTQGRYYMLADARHVDGRVCVPGQTHHGNCGEPFRHRAAGLAGQASRKRTAHRRAHALRLDHRSHPDQRSQGLRGSPQGPGWLHDCATVANGKGSSAGPHHNRSNRGHEDAPNDPGRKHGRWEVLCVRGGTDEAPPSAHHGPAHHRAHAAHRDRAGKVL